ncbi:MAG: hypothetical protein MJE68_28790 [Proteobacteria bacterium]|nr:hypothetical protein [Pseudomonadota bacterium]
MQVTQVMTNDYYTRQHYAMSLMQVTQVMTKLVNENTDCVGHEIPPIGCLSITEYNIASSWNLTRIEYRRKISTPPYYLLTLPHARDFSHKFSPLICWLAGFASPPPHKPSILGVPDEINAP